MIIVTVDKERVYYLKGFVSTEIDELPSGHVNSPWNQFPNVVYCPKAGYFSNASMQLTIK